MEKNVISINTTDGLAIFKRAVTDGVAPKDIAEVFGMTVSNVHYHKKKLKEQDVNFPDVRGQRPKGWISLPRWLADGTIGTEDDLHRENLQKVIKSQAETDPTVDEIQPDSVTPFNITINGTLFTISAKAKQIRIIGKDNIEVDF